MIPISRVEMYLAKICGEDVELPIPQTRKEVFLAIIAGEDYEKPVPSSRVELYLAKILGDDVPLPLPQSREEIFLAKIAGVEYPLPYPESRIEYWLHKWATYEEWETISGNPVSFTSLAAPLRKLQIAFSPVQDLHGYDSPWPAGGGKNVLDFKAALDFWGATYTENADGSFTVTNIGYGYTRQYQFASEDATYTMSAVSLINGSSASGWGVDFVSASGSGTGIIREGSLVAAGKTACKIRLNYSQPGDGFTIKNIQIEAGSTATSYAPYSNECPISGWDSLTVEMRGVNMWDEVWELGALNSTTGQDQSDSTHIRSENYIPVAPSTAYYNKGYTLAIFEYDANKAYLGYHNYAIGTFTTNANTRYLRFYRTATTYSNDISINYPSTDHDYHAYNPSSRSISISLGSTYYSGWVDAVTGIGEVTMASVDLGTLDWNYSASGNPFFYETKSDIMRPAGWGAIPNWLCSSYKTVSGNAVSGGTVGIGGNPNSSQIRLCDPTYTDPADFKTAMSGVQLVYELATPIPIQLTPQEINSLAGDNTMFTSCDSLTVEYRSN